MGSKNGVSGVELVGVDDKEDEDEDKEDEDENVDDEGA